MTEIQSLLGKMGLRGGKGRRHAADTTQGEVARVLGVSAPSVSRYLRGAAEPSPAVLRLARLIVWLRDEHPAAYQGIRDGLAER